MHIDTWWALIVLLFIFALGQCSPPSNGFDDPTFGPQSKADLRKSFPKATEEEIQWMYEGEMDYWTTGLTEEEAKEMYDEGDN